jgi:uncharacterized protein (DUF488 family)
MAGFILTIGHSTHEIEHFIGLLTLHSVTAVCDVRSHPYSKHNPQYNQKELKGALRRSGIEYVFLGRELGARSGDPDCYVNRKVRYDRIALTPGFRQGLDRIEKGMELYRLALMCAEKDPLACHRAILVARHLEARGLEVRHILENGTIETHNETMKGLSHQLGLSDQDLFLSKDQLTAEAYRIQGERIAYERPTPTRPIARTEQEGR